MVVPLRLMQRASEGYLVLERLVIAMIERILRTDDSARSLFLRVVLGATMLPHGAQKLLGAFGGYGYSATMDYFTGTVGLPAIIAFLVIVIESVGALSLVLGFATRLSALGIAAVMIGAAVTAHAQHGFFMNWFGNAGGEGFEYHILALGLALPLVATGGGLASIDRALIRKLDHAMGASQPLAPAM